MTCLQPRLKTMASPLPRYVRICLNPTPELLNSTIALLDPTLTLYLTFVVHLWKIVLIFAGLVNAQVCHRSFPLLHPKYGDNFHTYYCDFHSHSFNFAFPLPRSRRDWPSFSIWLPTYTIWNGLEKYICVHNVFIDSFFPTPFIRHVLHSRAKRAIVVVDLNKL